MIRIAILFEDNKVWIEFTPAKFRELLKTYYKKYKDIDLALDAIEKDIKDQTKYK